MKKPKSEKLRQIGVSPEIHRRCKTMAANTNKSLKVFVERVLLAALPRVK